MTKVSDLVLDEHNANKGTERGRYMLDHSLRQYGAGRSILLDKNGRIIAGNKTVEVATDVGIEDVIVVQTDGTKLVAVQRTDLDLETDQEARQLAYADNRASEVGLQWDPAALQFDLDAGLDLSGMFQEWELNRELGVIPDPVDYDELWQGMPEFVNESKAIRSIHIHFETQEAVDEFAALLGQKITESTRYIWYPAKMIKDMQSLSFEDES